MSAPPYLIKRTTEFNAIITEMKRKPGENRVKLKKIAKTVDLLREHGPNYPGLNAHRYKSLPPVIEGEPVWEVYVENRTPGAWRLFYCHGPGPDTLTLITVGPHP